MEENGSSKASTRPKWIAGLVIAFGLFHAASMLLGLLPRGVGVKKALAPYWHLTGTEQEWGMFYTIPTMQENAVTVEVADAAGSVTEFGPLLPGMKEYTTHSHIRHYYLLNRLTAPEKPYFDSYIEGLRGAVLEKASGSPVEFTLKVEGEYIRLLKRIQEDGEMTLRKPREHGPFLIKR